MLDESMIVSHTLWSSAKRSDTVYATPNRDIERSMTRAELITELAKRFPQLTHQDVDVSVKAILDALRDHLAAGERIELRGFGVFTLQERSPHKGRNPKTEEAVDVPEKLHPRFKPSIELQARVNHQITKL